MSAAVVMLPTAAPRKVRQCMSRTTSAQRNALLRFPDIYRTEQERLAEQDAVTIAAIEPSAALILSTALFQRSDAVTQTCVKMYAALSCDTDEGKQAAAWLRFVGGTETESRLIRAAMKRLAEGGF